MFEKLARSRRDPLCRPDGLAALPVKGLMPITRVSIHTHGVRSPEQEHRFLELLALGVQRALAASVDFTPEVRVYPDVDVNRKGERW